MISISLRNRRISIALLLGLFALFVCLRQRFSLVYFGAVVVMLLVAGAVGINVNGGFASVLPLLTTTITALITVIVIQLANGMKNLPQLYKLLLGTLCLLPPILLLWVLSGCFPRRDWRIPVVVVTGVYLFAGIINKITYTARGTGISPVDLASIPTALAVVGTYQLRLTNRMFCAVGVWAAVVLLLFGLHIEYNNFLRKWQAFIAGLCCLLLSFVLFLVLEPIRPLFWEQQGTATNGFVLNFNLQLLALRTEKPKGYDLSEIKAAGERFSCDWSDPDEKPDVIVIMNEAFADLGVYGEIETNIPVTPCLDARKEECLLGQALSSVYGGTTPNSEFEFLTGISMAFFDAFEIPFTQKIRQPIYSLARYFAALGYDTFATHPMSGSNWRRDTVYPYLGFEQLAFEDEYPEQEYRYKYPLDKGVYSMLLKQLTMHDGMENPCFLYAVTAQNHGSYTHGAEFEEQIKLLNAGSHEMDEYLTCIHESDAAFGRFLDALIERERPTVVLMFGDHHPKEETELIRDLHGGELETLDEQELRYTVPYVIWANFTLEGDAPELTSLNYLSSILLESAKLPLPPFNCFLETVRSEIPSINAYGYYSKENGCFLNMDAAMGKERELLELYSMLAYNAAADHSHNSETFFPLDW